MEYETYLADDGTIRRREVRNGSASQSAYQNGRMVLRDDGTIYSSSCHEAHGTVSSTANNQTIIRNRSVRVERHPASLFEKFVVWVMVLFCMVSIPQLLSLNMFFITYNETVVGALSLWVIPIFITAAYFSFKENDMSRITDAWYCASMITLLTSHIINIGAYGFLMLIAGGVFYLAAGGLLLFYVYDESNFKEYLIRIMVLSFCVLFIPCIIMAGTLCGGHLDRIASLNGALHLMAVAPALVDITVAIVISVKEIHR